MLMYIFNINTKTRYSNIWLRPITYRKLQKYLKQWRIMLAHLNKRMDLYFQKHYKVVAYNIKTLPIRENHIQWRPHNHKKRRQAQQARKACMQIHNLTQGLHYMVMTTTTSNPHRVGFDTDSYDILVDNCCSKSITNCLADFITPPKQSTMMIKGFNGATATTRVGTVRWHIQDDAGKTHTLTLPQTYYSASVQTRLLSPQHWAQTAKQGNGTKCTTYHNRIILSWDKGKYKRTIPLASSNVGVITAPPGIQRFMETCKDTMTSYPLLSFPATIHLAAPAHPDLAQTIQHDTQVQDQPTESTKTYHTCQDTSHDKHSIGNHNRVQPISVTFEQEDNDILNQHPTFMDEQQEYMRWHYKLNHASQRVMTKMAYKGMLPKPITKILRTLDKQGRKGPMCNDCYSASATRTPWRTKPDNSKRQEVDKREKLSPGDIISVDQLESSTPGFIGQIAGALTRQRIVGSTIFVDQASDLSYVYHHLSMTSEETVLAKESFERYAKSHGVTIKHYHADNGRFKDKAFMRSVEQNGQSISFSGVGAHHQNGIAEKRIGDLQRRATTLLLHAQRRWPDAITTHLWPYAVRAANDSRNNTVTHKYDECPMSRFCKTARVPPIRNQHHFGCPVYVLNKDMQDGKKARKWVDRTRIGINLGYSPRHAHSVSLVLNIETGLVSPQYHCSYDDLFETTTGTQARSIPRSKWQYKAGLAMKEEIDPPHDEDTKDNSHDYHEQEEDTEYEGAHEEEDNNDTEQAPEDETQANPYVTRSGRISRAPDRLNLKAFESILEPYDYSDWDDWCEKDLFAFKAGEEPLAMKASTDPDTMYYHQAMREPDKDKFQEAIKKECEDHFRESNYKLINIDEVPKDATLLSSVWQMKRKRKPSTGEISKYKARMNVDGSKMIKGIHYEETYAPVVAWATIRFFLTLAVINNWHTRQLDFLLAFTQADIERDLYMKLPAGFVIPGRTLTDEDRKKYVLKLEKNLYGQKQAGRVWYQHLRRNLMKLGFKASNIDECVFYYGRTIFIVYTDDTILIGPDQKEIEELIKKLGKVFKIEDQGDLSDYLGIKIEKHKNGTMEWTQPVLISSVLKDLGLDKVDTKNPPKTKSTPANSTTILTDFKDDKDHDNHFDYRKVIGKLLYLEKSTRPDISCAVHQCARFCANPKMKHAEAVKRIGRYLLATRDKGLIMTPNKEGMDCWVDASHASEWSNKSSTDDPNTARSRMGYVITYAGCPMHWASKMQTEIALSSTEAEYIALSQAMREVIPIIWLLQEASDQGISFNNSKPKVHCTIFEDNAGAIEIAQVPKMRPRTKHLNIKYHHFREEVKKGTISIYHVGTKDQMADIFTKPLEEGLFVKFRQRMIGW